MYWSMAASSSAAAFGQERRDRLIMTPSRRKPVPARPKESLGLAARDALSFWRWMSRSAGPLRRGSGTPAPVPLHEVPYDRIGKLGRSGVPQRARASGGPRRRMDRRTPGPGHRRSRPAEVSSPNTGIDRSESRRSMARGHGRLPTVSHGAPQSGAFFETMQCPPRRAIIRSCQAVAIRCSAHHSNRKSRANHARQALVLCVDVGFAAGQMEARPGRVGCHAVRLKSAVRR